MISRESSGHQRLTAQKNERTKAKVATGVHEVVGEVQRAVSEVGGAPRRRQPPRWPVGLSGRDRWAHTVAGPHLICLLPSFTLCQVAREVPGRTSAPC